MPSRDTRRVVWVMDEYVAGQYLHFIGYDAKFIALGQPIEKPHPNLGRYRGPIGDDWDDFAEIDFGKGWSRLPLAANVYFAVASRR